MNPPMEIQKEQIFTNTSQITNKIESSNTKERQKCRKIVFFDNFSFYRIQIVRARPNLDHL